MADEKKKLGEILLEAGVIDKFQLKSALAEQNKWGGRLGNHLVQMGILSEDLLVKALSKQLKIPNLDLSQMQVTADVLELVPQEIAEKFHLVPVAVKKIANKKTLIVAMSDPTNLDAVDELQFRTGHIIKPAVAGDAAIELAIRRYYYGETGPQRLPGQPIEFEPAPGGAPAVTNVPTPDVPVPPESTFALEDAAAPASPPPAVPPSAEVPEASLAELAPEAAALEPSFAPTTDSGVWPAADAQPAWAEAPAGEAYDAAAAEPTYDDAASGGYDPNAAVADPGAGHDPSAGGYDPGAGSDPGYAASAVGDPAYDVAAAAEPPAGNPAYNDPAAAWNDTAAPAWSGEPAGAPEEPTVPADDATAQAWAPASETGAWQEPGGAEAAMETDPAQGTLEMVPPETEAAPMLPAAGEGFVPEEERVSAEAWPGAPGYAGGPGESAAPELSAPPEASVESPVAPEPGPAEAAVEAMEQVPPDWSPGDAVQTLLGGEQHYEPTMPGEPTHAPEESAPGGETAPAENGAWPDAGHVNGGDSATQPAYIAPDPFAAIPFETAEGRAIRALCALLLEKGFFTAEEIAARIRDVENGGGEGQG